MAGHGGYGYPPGQYPPQPGAYPPQGYPPAGYRPARYPPAARGPSASQRSVVIGIFTNLSTMQSSITDLHLISETKKKILALKLGSLGRFIGCIIVGTVSLMRIWIVLPILIKFNTLIRFAGGNYHNGVMNQQQQRPRLSGNPLMNAAVQGFVGGAVQGFVGGEPFVEGAAQGFVGGAAQQVGQTVGAE
ncbi:hypothetical protein Pint_16808 [Pistacia integerrima]|uniref:Uncharacterized protein n=1 Tax=Pistacia integerrima TaxID=434235 RepID=A0ACC0ZDP8_9ROSI|nr:hypothetical protein Pint_16808 [Pistacia integerrima]